MIERLGYSVVALNEKPGQPKTPAQEPISVDELVAIARIVAGDEELGLMPMYISAARQQAELDTDLAIAQQQFLVTFDTLPVGVLENTPPLAVPLPRPPLVSIDYVTWTDTNDVDHTVIPWYYRADTASIPGRLIWSPPAGWTPPDDQTPRTYQAWAVTMTAGYAPDAVPPGLKRAIGLLAAHYLTTGRDLAVAGGLDVMPWGYDEAIQPFRQVTLI